MVKTITLHIKGMHCNSCEALLEDDFEDLGASKSQIDHKAGTAKVTFDESKITVGQLKAVVKEEGYTVTSINE